VFPPVPIGTTSFQFRVPSRISLSRTVARRRWQRCRSRRWWAVGFRALGTLLTFTLVGQSRLDALLSSWVPISGNAGFVTALHLPFRSWEPLRCLLSGKMSRPLPVTCPSATDSCTISQISWGAEEDEYGSSHMSWPPAAASCAIFQISYDRDRARDSPRVDFCLDVRYGLFTPNEHLGIGNP
jgi:hypothetical protein